MKFLRPFHLKVGVPGGSVGKVSTCDAGDLGSIPGSGRFPGEGRGYPLQYSGLKNTIDCIVYGVAESDTTERLTCPLRSMTKLLYDHKEFSCKSSECQHDGSFLSAKLSESDVLKNKYVK